MTELTFSVNFSKASQYEREEEKGIEFRSLKTLTLTLAPKFSSAFSVEPNTTATMLASSSLAPTLHSLSSLRRRSVVSIFVSSKNPLHGGHRFASSGLRLFASIAERRSLELSWSTPEENSGDGYGGWAVSDPLVLNHSEKRGIFKRIQSDSLTIIIHSLEVSFFIFRLFFFW